MLFRIELIAFITSTTYYLLLHNIFFASIGIYCNATMFVYTLYELECLLIHISQQLCTLYIF